MMTEYYEISHSSIQSEEYASSLESPHTRHTGTYQQSDGRLSSSMMYYIIGVSFINVCHASITYMYINPSLRSIEATSIQMSKGAPSHMHFVAASIRYT